MKRQLFLLQFVGFFLLFHSFVFAQTGTLRGIVYDENLENAMGASVLIKNTDFYAVSDFNGVFIVPDLPFGNYVMEVSYIGYGTETISVTIDKKNADLVKVFLKKHG